MKRYSNSKKIVKVLAILVVLVQLVGPNLIASIKDQTQIVKGISPSSLAFLDDSFNTIARILNPFGANYALAAGGGGGASQGGGGGGPCVPTTTCADIDLSTRCGSVFDSCRSYCGNGTSPDCAVCGNGVVEAGETCRSCPADAGTCPVVCGDGYCDGGEDAYGCASDCCANQAWCSGGPGGGSITYTKYNQLQSPYNSVVSFYLPVNADITALSWGNIDTQNSQWNGFNGFVKNVGEVFHWRVNFDGTNTTRNFTDQIDSGYLEVLDATFTRTYGSMSASVSHTTTGVAATVSVPYNANGGGYLDMTLKVKDDAFSPGDCRPYVVANRINNVGNTPSHVVILPEKPKLAWPTNGNIASDASGNLIYTFDVVNNTKVLNGISYPGGVNSADIFINFYANNLTGAYTFVTGHIQSGTLVSQQSASGIVLSLSNVPVGKYKATVVLTPTGGGGKTQYDFTTSVKVPLCANNSVSTAATSTYITNGTSSDGFYMFDYKHQNRTTGFVNEEVLFSMDQYSTLHPSNTQWSSPLFNNYLVDVIPNGMDFVEAITEGEGANCQYSDVFNAPFAIVKFSTGTYNLSSIGLSALASNAFATGVEMNGVWYPPAGMDAKDVKAVAYKLEDNILYSNFYYAPSGRTYTAGTPYMSMGRKVCVGLKTKINGKTSTWSNTVGAINDQSVGTPGSDRMVLDGPVVGTVIPAQIGGVVYIDSLQSLDRVYGTGDTTRPGVALELLSGGTIIQTGVSQANGRYLFDGLATGCYDVRYTTGYGTLTIWSVNPEQPSSTLSGLQQINSVCVTENQLISTGNHFGLLSGYTDLWVTKREDRTRYFSGDAITWTIQYGNSGVIASPNTVITDAGGGNWFTTGSTTWNLGTLNPGQTGEIILTGNVYGFPLETGTNTISITGDRFDIGTPNNSFTKTFPMTRPEDISVGGCLYYDRDYSHSYNAGESYLSGITVTFSGVDNFNRPLYQSMQSDAAGCYHFIFSGHLAILGEVTVSDYSNPITYRPRSSHPGQLTGGEVVGAGSDLNNNVILSHSYANQLPPALPHNPVPPYKIQDIVLVKGEDSYYNDFGLVLPDLAIEYDCTPDKVYSQDYLECVVTVKNLAPLITTGVGVTLEFSIPGIPGQIPLSNFTLPPFCSVTNDKRLDCGQGALDLTGNETKVFYFSGMVMQPAVQGQEVIGKSTVTLPDTDRDYSNNAESTTNLVVNRPICPGGQCKGGTFIPEGTTYEPEKEKTPEPQQELLKVVLPEPIKEVLGLLDKHKSTHAVAPITLPDTGVEDGNVNQNTKATMLLALLLLGLGMMGYRKRLITLVLTALCGIGFVVYADLSTPDPRSEFEQKIAGMNTMSDQRKQFILAVLHVASEQSASDELLLVLSGAFHGSGGVVYTGVATSGVSDSGVVYTGVATSGASDSGVVYTGVATSGASDSGSLNTKTSNNDRLMSGENDNGPDPDVADAASSTVSTGTESQ